MAIHLYKEATQGLRDGIRCSEGTELIPVDDRRMETSVDQETSPILLMARCDQLGQTSVGPVTMTPVRGTNLLWNLAWGSVPNTWAGWGQTLTVYDGIDDRNRPVYAKYKVIAGEASGSDISVDIHIEGRIGVFQGTAGGGDTKRIILAEDAGPGDTLRIVAAPGRETGWFVYDPVSFPNNTRFWYVKQGIVGDLWVMVTEGGWQVFTYNIPQQQLTPRFAWPSSPPDPYGNIAGGTGSENNEVLLSGNTIWRLAFIQDALGTHTDCIGLFRYDLNTDVWTYVSEVEVGFTFPPRVPDWAALYGDILYWHRGGEAAIRTYDLLSGNWGLFAAPFDVSQTLSVRDGDTVYFIGGAENALRFLSLDLATLSWTLLPSLPAALLQGAGGFAEDGNLYVIGGQDYGALTYRWNGSVWAADTWSTYPRFPMSQSSENGAYAVYDWGGSVGKELFAIGGTSVTQRILNHYVL